MAVYRISDTFSVAPAWAALNNNLLHNGAMQVAQRGTSTTGITTSGYRTADRWNAGVITLGTWTQSVENDAPTGSGFRKSLKMLATTADASPASGDELYVEQVMEGQDLQRIAKGTTSAQQLTLSFWTKSNVTGTYVVMLYDADNTRHICATYTISASATWERKTITFAADTTGALDNDNAASLLVRFWLAGGSGVTGGTLATSWAAYTAANAAVGQTNLAAATNNYWQVTGVQLEVGPVATPFEFKSYGQELAECQRYFQWVNTGFGRASSTTNIGMAVSSTVAMRATPVVTYVTGTNALILPGTGYVNITAVGSSYGGINGSFADLTGTGFTAGNNYGINPAVNGLSLVADL